MNNKPTQVSLKRGKKACTECRQQKAKCDAYLNPDRPCTRCVRMKAQCMISDPFRREHKRQRLSKLEQETDELRQKLRSSQSVHSQPSPITMSTVAAEMGGHEKSNVDGLHPTPQSQVSPVSFSQPLTSTSLESPRVEFPSERVSDHTLQRTLDGIEVTGEEINEIFHLFFEHYAQFLPILDPQTSPNTFYAQSPFLFWAVIGVACRTYPRNPTLITSLARGIADMALLSPVSSSAPWHTIQGLLLILTWPMPRDNTKTDLIFPLSGMLLHTAMQNGLHFPMSSHEFTKIKIPAPSEEELIQRSELWARCVIVYQRSCAMKGHPAHSFMRLEQDLGQRQGLLRKIAPCLGLERQCQELIARCSTAVLELGVRTMSAEQERALDILLRTYEMQVTDIEYQVATSQDRFQTTSCRLCVQMFHLLKSQTLSSSDCLPRLLDTACSAIDWVQELSKKLPDLAAVPQEIYFGVILAAITLLRICKGTPNGGLDVEKGRPHFFTAINLVKQMSIQNNDTAAKAVLVLNQLWNSTKAFRKLDGSAYTALRIRSRLILSPVVDAVWWWREEHDPQCRLPSGPQGIASDGVEGNQDITKAVANAPVSLTPRQEPMLFDDQFFANFEWALGDDGLFLPTELYGSGWSAL
ncbi:hypothetical protein BDV25DRAFT_100090 [Aspergillus avenaceus]|uniref:Zn(2)-C6 fungal-type domain-containing protein n=1 Tax=Aspergillus avenaceus TaxID=36643 RepID=A0A5N6TXH8_ASPAV|nr:hypothetical protein BDV25DRAFT_100090 [Aspergillus avenaceus]